MVQRDWSGQSSDGASLGGITAGPSADDDPVRQVRRPLGHVEDGLLGQLLGVMGPGSAPQDDPATRIADVQVADAAAGPPLDLPPDRPGQLVLGPVPDTPLIILPDLLRPHGEPPCRRNPRNTARSSSRPG